eukprot:TRINITY_DN27318_c0_g1_i1.p1 TRINITY_DN27318_c0_g1~~TRINITY_DN27318_c0_g1_i1.p1  ORF type:complete len:893 (-),score=179.64 TRINITY_DN27318_c0_g1_i1:51-2729(-)
MASHVRPFCQPLQAPMPFTFSSHATLGPRAGLFDTALPHPPFKLSPEELGLSKEQLESVANCAWLFSPTPVRQFYDQAETQDDFDAGIPDLQGPSTAFSPGYPQHQVHERPPIPYECPLRSPEARRIVDILLSWYSTGPAEGSIAKRLGQALQQYPREAYKALTSKLEDGQLLVPDDERQKLIEEGPRVATMLVQYGVVSVARGDLDCSLEAFGLSRGHPPTVQQWLCRSLGKIIISMLAAAPIEDQERWRMQNQLRVADDDMELYGVVDVRAWRFVLQLLKADSTKLNRRAFCSQVQVQLCSFGVHRFDGLHQAAKLIAALGQASVFGTEMLDESILANQEPEYVNIRLQASAMKIREVFNDKTLQRKDRQELLKEVLKGAPRRLVREVLAQLDEAEIDAAERDEDDELRLIYDLLFNLDEDVRCCSNVFFKLKRDWVAGRRAGTVLNEELTAEQLCDHIEDEVNYEELLKVAVNKCSASNRKFEAARMLARKAGGKSKVAETNRNDRQLHYLISIYKDEEATDHYGPLEEGCVALPYAFPSVYHVARWDGSSLGLEELQRELLDKQEPMAIGISWLWRCFNAHLDMHAKAAVLAIAWPRGVALVDMMKLETDDFNDARSTERSAKEVLRQILEAPHLLKVVHLVDARAWRALQLALVPKEDLEDSYSPPSSRMFLSPMVDIAVLCGFMKRTAAKQQRDLNSLVFSYLRMELCHAEALGNFERRPLRQSQIHYALTQAYIPLVLIRCFCAYGLLSDEEVLSFAVSLGPEALPGGDAGRWDEELHSKLRFNTYGESVDQPDADGIEWGKNIWEDPEEVDKLPKPERRRETDWARMARTSAAQMQIAPSQSVMAGADRAVKTLFDPTAAALTLHAFYQACRDHDAQRLSEHRF